MYTASKTTLVLSMALLLMLLSVVPAVAETKIRPGDEISVEVWTSQEMSRTIRVGQDGKIAMPLVGSLQVAGLNEEEAGAELAGRLKKYLLDPRTSVHISQPRPERIYVLGQVKSPGMYDIRSGATLLEGVSLAGGLLEKADIIRASVVRGGKDTLKVDMGGLLERGRIQENISLQDGDVLFVPERPENTVYVLGKVSKPGLYRAEESMTVMGAIAQANGVVERADMSRVTVIRGSGKDEKLVVDVKRIVEKGDKSLDMQLAAGDTVYVPEVGSIDWDKMLNRLWIFSIVRDLF